MSTRRVMLIAGVLAAAMVVGIAALSSALDKTPKQPGLPLTIGIDGGYTGWSETEIAERAGLGAEITRHEWSIHEPVTDQDDVMEVAFGRVGTRIHALLGGNELTPPDRYRQWVLEFIGRYGVGGSFWDEHPEYDEGRFAITSIELGNEPYVGVMTAPEYAEAVEPALRAIAARDLPVTVVLPTRLHGTDTAWMDGLYARIPDLNELFDAFALHPYWYGRSPTAEGAFGPIGRIEALRKEMDGFGAEGKPIWITEYGQSTALCGVECVTEEAQALHLQQMLDAIRLHPEWRVRMISIFQLRDRGTDSGDRELQFGLLREDGSRKPSYRVVEAAVQASR